MYLVHKVLRVFFQDFPEHMRFREEEKIRQLEEAEKSKKEKSLPRAAAAPGGHGLQAPALHKRLSTLTKELSAAERMKSITPGRELEQIMGIMPDGPAGSLKDDSERPKLSNPMTERRSNENDDDDFDLPEFNFDEMPSGNFDEGAAASSAGVPSGAETDMAIGSDSAQNVPLAPATGAEAAELKADLDDFEGFLDSVVKNNQSLK